MTFSFDGDIAERYGISEAIMLNHIAFWLLKNEGNDQNIFEGRVWTYNSAKAYSKIFPFWSERTVQRIIKHLVDEGLLLVGNFNNDPRNRTNYYSLSDKGSALMTSCRIALRQVGVMDNDKVAESFSNTSNIYNNNNSIEHTVYNNIPPISPLTEKEENRKKLFAEFWQAYPKCFRKVNRKGCEKKFIKIENLEKIFPDIMASLELQKRSKQWNEENGQYIPQPATWINQERWTIEDERLQRQQIIDEITKTNIDDFFE